MLRKTKKIVCVLVVFSLVLQIGFYPLKAQAEERGLIKFLKRIFSSIKIPDKVEITNDGKLKMGGLNILNLDPTGLLPEDPQNPGEHCLYINPKTYKCDNPVNEIDKIIFPEDSSYTKQTNSFLKPDGSLNITQPKVPTVCQLNLIRPVEKGGEDLAEDEQLARRRACNDLIRLQNAAAQAAFTAKSIFQKTNPKSDCLFLKNCKSDCVLRFGEVKYVITIFDIAEFLLPTGWLSVVHKIVNVIAMFAEVQKVLQMASAIFKDGIDLVNGFIQTFNYLGNLFTSLQGLGNNLSAYLGVVAVAAQGTMAGLGEAGADISGTVRTVVDVGTVAVGGVAAASVLNKSFGSMKEMLGRFSDNMLAYGQAKTQTSQLILGIRMDIVDLIEGDQAKGLPGIKKEQKLAFLFQPQSPQDSSKKQELDKIVTDFRSFFENSTELLERMSLPGQLIGKTVLEVSTGAQSEYEDLAKQNRVHIAYDFGKPVDTVYGDRTFSEKQLQGQPANLSYHFNPVYLSALGNPGLANDLVVKTEPEYVQNVLDCALGCKGESCQDALSCSNNYKEGALDEKIDSWRHYWEDIGKTILGDAEVSRILSMEECPYFNERGMMSCKLGEIQREIIEKKTSGPTPTAPFAFLKKIAELDRVVNEMIPNYGGGFLPVEAPVINYSQDSNRTKTISALFDDYMNARLEKSFLEFDSPTSTKVCAFVGDRVKPWDSNCPSGSTTTAPELAQFAADTDPVNVQSIITNALGDIEDTHYKYDILDYSKDLWRATFWETMCERIGVDVAGILAQDLQMETKHKAIMNECIAKYPFLAYLRDLEGKGYKNEGAVANLDYKISVYGLERQNTGLFSGCDIHLQNPKPTWLETFQQSYAEISGLAKLFSETSPAHLSSWLPTILDCYQATPKDDINCSLNWENNKWRHYWEGLYSALYGWDDNKSGLKNILSQDATMDDKLDEVQSDVISKYTPAQKIKDIQDYINTTDLGYENTLEGIQSYINEYQTAREGFVGLGSLAAITVNSAIKQIGRLGFHDQDLEDWQYTPDRYINGKHRKYWQSEIWPDDPMCSEDKTKFTQTYDSDLAEVDWQGRINAMIDAPQNLLLVQEAMQNGLTPEVPLVNYKVDKASQAFYNAVITTESAFEPIADSLYPNDACALAVNFHYSLNYYNDYPENQYNCSPDATTYCCNISDCQTKMNNALNSCGSGTPTSEQEWQDLSWKTYQKYYFVDNWFNNFAGYLSKTWNEELKKYDIVYIPFEQTQAGKIISNVKIIIEALDYIWQNDLTVVEPENKMEALKGILDKLNDGSSGWMMPTIKSYFSAFEPNSSEESSIVGKFVANILATKYLIIAKFFNSQDNYGLIVSLDNLSKSNDWQEMLSPEEIIKEVEAWPIDQSQKEGLENTINNVFGPALSAVKIETLDKFKQNLGEYAFGYNWYPNFAEYSASSTCPEDIKTKGFLSRLSCLEWKNKSTFEVMRYPLQGMSDLEKALFLLTDANQDFDGTSSIKENVDNLKPSIRTEVMQIDEGLGQDWLKKVSDKVSDVLNDPFKAFQSIWEKDEYHSPEGSAAPPNLTTDTGEKITNWKDFKEALTANPVLALQSDFDSIKAKIGQIVDKLNNAWWQINTLWSWQTTEDGNQNYGDSIWEISSSRLGKLSASVFGNKENQDACQGVSILLGSALSSEIEQTCKLKSEGGKKDPDVLNDTALQDQCKEIEEIASLESDLDLANIDSDIARLQNQRACAAKETCSDETTPCVKCPEWFCLNEGVWGAGSESIDPFCIEVKNGLHPDLSLTGPNTSNIVWSASLQMKDREWPPKTKCICQESPAQPCFSQNYQGVQPICIETQKQLADLRQRKEGGGAAADPAMLAKCAELDYQKALQIECDNFAIAQKAMQDKCGDLSNDVPEYCPNKEQEPCKSPREICENVKTQIRAKFCANTYASVLNGIDCASGFPDLTANTEQNQKDLETVEELCEKVQDIKTPLNEIMKVYSVLIGIRSGTLAYGGVKSTITDAKKLYENIKKFIKMVEELPKKMKAAFDTANSKTIKGGIRITPLKCIAKPAGSTASGRVKNGPEGGQVCPEVSTLYQQMQGQFSVIRNQLHQIDLARRVVNEITIPLWKTESAKGYIHIFDDYPIKYHSIDPLYDRAETVKQKAQYVWALTTAIDFANSQCTCGQSFCKLPFCISGLPLTLQPLKDPYCSLVWLLRIPLNDLAESLNRELKTLPK